METVKNKRFKKIILYIFILFWSTILSCNKNDGPYIEIINNYTFTKFGDKQKIKAGNYLTDSIGIIINNALYFGDENLSANFSIIYGEGTTETDNLFFNNYVAVTKWKTGKSTTKQELKIEIFNEDNKRINTSYFNAFAFDYNRWDTVSCLPDRNIRDVLADTIANQTLMIDYITLYRQKENYFDWEAQKNFENIYQLQMDDAGVIYLSAYRSKGIIYKSIDHGISWFECTNPIPENNDFYTIKVSPNGNIWASNNSDNSFRCSRDGGLSWSADTIGLEKDDKIGDIFYLSTGQILFLSTNTRLYISSDDGRSWTKMQAPEYPLKLYVTNNDEIIIINQDNGISIYKSPDLGQTYSLKYSVSPIYGTSMQKSIQKVNGMYYILVPGYGILKTPDFETYDTFVKNTSMVFLYQDHTGTLIARGLQNKYAYYYKEKSKK